MFLRELGEIFIFSKRERNGILFLLSILLFVVVLDLMLPLFLKEQVYDTTAWREKAEAYFAQSSSDGDTLKVQFSGTLDPNRVQISELLKIGIPATLAANWVRYLERGGHFKKKEELLRLYGMTADKLATFGENLSFTATRNADSAKTGVKRKLIQKWPTQSSGDALKKWPTKPDRKRETVEVNSADSAQLEALPGIGPVLASRIIKYRRLLGGFYDVSQLMKIYGMSEELWQRSAPHLSVDTSGIRKVEINFLSLTDLGHHPYIGFRLAKKIIRKRDTDGKFRTKEELATIFSPDSLRQLLPYLSLTGTEK